MKRLCAASAALGLILAAHTVPAQAQPRQDAGAIAFVSDLDSTAQAVTDEIYLIDPTTRRVHRLTDDLPGVERWPTVSPDGRSLAWVRVVTDGAGVPRPDVKRDLPL